MRSKYGFLPMLLLTALPCRPLAQCGGVLTLKTTGYCLGDTLTVVVSDSIVKIDWYNGAALDSTVWQVDQGIIGYTVAGGNGYGYGADQLEGPAGIFVDPAGNLYLADVFNDRIQKWSPGSNFGLTVAGGNGQGYAANQLILPWGIFGDQNGFIFVSKISPPVPPAPPSCGRDLLYPTAGLYGSRWLPASTLVFSAVVSKYRRPIWIVSRR
jgi:hypothetical protein